MATPQTVVDGTTDNDEAVLNLFLRAGKLQVKMNYFVLSFVAATNVVTVSSGRDSDGEVVSADAVWNAGSVRIDITLTGFTAAPVILATILDNSSTNVAALEAGDSATSVLGTVEFMGAGAGPANVDPNGDISINVIVIGA